MCCDGCVRAFHPACLPEKMQSELEQMADDEQWMCMFCRRRAQDEEDEDQVRSLCKSVNVMCMSVDVYGRVYCVGSERVSVCAFHPACLPEEMQS